MRCGESTMSFTLSLRTFQYLMCGFYSLVLVTSVRKQDSNICLVTNITRPSNFSFHLFSGKWYRILYLANGGNPVAGLMPCTLEFVEIPENSTDQGTMRVSGLLSPQQGTQSSESTSNNTCCSAARVMQATDSPYRFQLKDTSNSTEESPYSDMWIANTDYVNFAVILGCSAYYRNSSDCINPYCWVLARETLFQAEVAMNVITTVKELCLQNENFVLSNQNTGCQDGTGNVSVGGMQCITASPSPSPEIDNMSTDMTDEQDTGDLVLGESPEGVSRFVLKDGHGKPCLLASFTAEFRISYTAFEKDKIIISSIQIGLDEPLSVSGSCSNGKGTTATISVLWIKQAINLTLTFNTEQKDESGAFWYMSRVGFNYDSNIYQLFPSAYQPAKRHAISEHLHLYSTPVGFSYQCNTGDEISLTEYKLKHKVILQNLHLQPVGVQGSDHFSRAIICQRDFVRSGKAKENKIVLILIVSFVAVLIILFVAALIVDRLKKYHRYKYKSISAAAPSEE